MKKMFSIISKRDAGLALLGRMAAALLLAPVSQSLAQVVDDFTPTTSLEIDAQAGPVNGQAVKEGRLQLNFRRIEIPPGVQVRFKGFRAVALQAEEASIAGTLILYGGAGEAGRPARGGEAGRGGDGGSGYGAGLPGQGGLPNGADGRSGGGSLGPGHPGPPVEGSCGVGCSDPAGGAASGSNGTSGGHGIGCWQGQVRYLESEALGRDDAFDTSVPPGGGSGGGGGCRRGEWAGGGGGGGGSSGGLEIQVRESITVSGQILVNGGPGGIGG
ncbi:MAG: hypothetical protein HY232_16520, partial [Acidobacteria bacterium]|nr:hypothetical protein [Acidobacteriota bacterium]